ncbi:hypothetical protein IEO21_00481 [Rhodonia placenta]|uniref:Uncharacterized protein n=1 Tax=Rhodonia placenta TaxID=104341 RepID=A0A8H7PBA8_9APHY|nr:hypothetical protein IEO21_00481 [Postia placenta]
MRSLPHYPRFLQRYPRLPPYPRRNQGFFANHPVISTFLIAIGLLSIVKLILQAINRLVKARIGAARYGAGQGAWAVVTNATDGRARECAFRLAREGFNILVTGRDQAALDLLLSEISSSRDPEATLIQMKALVIDQVRIRDDEQWKNVVSELADLDIGVLVLHEDKTYKLSNDISTVSDQAVDDVLTANVFAPAKIAKLVLPGMAQKERGLILIIGSAISTSWLASVRARGVDVRTLRAETLMSRPALLLDKLANTALIDQVQWMTNKSFSATKFAYTRLSVYVSRDGTRRLVGKVYPTTRILVENASRSVQSFTSIVSGMLSSAAVTRPVGAGTAATPPAVRLQDVGSSADPKKTD